MVRDVTTFHRRIHEAAHTEAPSRLSRKKEGTAQYAGNADTLAGRSKEGVNGVKIGEARREQQKNKNYFYM